MTEEQIKYVEGQLADAKRLCEKITRLKKLLNFTGFILRAGGDDVEQPLANEIVTLGLSLYLQKAEESLAKAQIVIDPPEPLREEPVYRAPRHEPQ